MRTQDFIATVAAAVNEQVRREVETSGQMTLGTFISALERCKPDSYIVFDWGGLHPGAMRSYRGYYDHLAIDPTTGDYRLVRQMLEHAKSVLGTTMEGYKGGNYVMGGDTPLWVAVWGDTGATRVVGVSDDDYIVTIKTAVDKS